MIVLGDGDLLHISANLRDDWNDVSIDCRVVGRFMRPPVHPFLCAPRKREYRDQDSDCHRDLTASW